MINYYCNTHPRNSWNNWTSV